MTPIQNLNINALNLIITTHPILSENAASLIRAHSNNTHTTERPALSPKTLSTAQFLGAGRTPREPAAAQKAGYRYAGSVREKKVRRREFLTGAGVRREKNATFHSFPPEKAAPRAPEAPLPLPHRRARPNRRGAGNRAGFSR